MKLEEKIVFAEEKDSPIVIIDSGLGGAYNLGKLADRFPVENFVYFCDNEMLPLGNMEEAVLNRRINKLCKVIKTLDPKAIVIACNTIDSVSYDSICAIFPNIKVYSVILPTVRKALEVTQGKNIALIGTKMTIENQAYMKYAIAKPNLNMYGVECINLAKAIEYRENVKEVFQEETAVLQEIEFETLILGCTHYSLIKSYIRKKYPDKKIIDCSEELILDVMQNFKEANKNKANKQRIYAVFTKEMEEEAIDTFKKVIKKDFEVVNIQV